MSYSRKINVFTRFGRSEPPQHGEKTGLIKKWNRDERAAASPRSNPFLWLGVISRFTRRKRLQKAGDLTLPLDIIAEVVKFLDVDDLSVLSQVSRSFNIATSSRGLWNKFLEEDVANYHPLVMNEFSDPADMSPQELKTVVLRSRRLLSNWESGRPTCTSPTSPVFLENIHASKMRGVGAQIFGGNHVIVSFTDRSLACFRTDTGVRLNMCLPLRISYPFVFPHPKSSSLYIMTTEFVSEDSTSLKISLMVTRLRLPPAVGNMDDVHFEQAQTMTLPPCAVLSKCCDVGRRRICVLCLTPNSVVAPITLKLFVVMDWDEKKYVLLDSGLTGISMRTKLTARFTEDGKGLVVFVHARRLRWQLYDMDELQERAVVASEGSDPKIQYILPRQSKAHIFTHDIYVGGFTIERVLTLCVGPLWQDYMMDVPRLHSNVYVMRSTDTVNFDATKYRLVQFYTTDDGPLNRHFAVDLHFCLTNPGEAFPMVAVSFNHFAWVARRLDMGAKRWTFRLELMLGSFPMPHEPSSWSPKDKVRKVDIPDDVLENAARIFLAPSDASIMIVTSGGRLHTFRYA